MGWPRRASVLVLLSLAACASEGDLSDAVGGPPPPNRAPIALAGDDVGVAVGQTVALDGARSRDPDGDALTFRWSIVIRPDGSTAALTGATTTKPALTSDLRGTYVVELVVSDGPHESVPDRVTVRAGIDNIAPVAQAGPDYEVLTETRILLDGVDSTDANGDDLQHHWRAVEVPPLSQLSGFSTTGASVLTVADVTGTYRFELRVSDGKLWSEPDELVVVASRTGPPPEPLDLPARALVADPRRGLLYASVARTSRVPGTADAVVAIDPALRQVTGVVLSGGDPGALAISPDGASLFVGRLDGTVVRVDLDSGTSDPPVALGERDDSRPRVAGQMAVVPGEPRAVVVSTRYRDQPERFAGMEVLDATGRRSVGLPAGLGLTALVASDQTGRLYAVDDRVAAFGLFTLDVDATGLSVAAQLYRDVPGSFHSLSFDRGWVFSSSGHAFDTAHEMRMEIYPIAGPVLPAEEMVYFVTSAAVDREPHMLRKVARETRIEVDQARLRLPLRQRDGAATHLVRWGSRGAAFIHQPEADGGYEASVVVIESDLIGR